MYLSRNGLHLCIESTCHYQKYIYLLHIITKSNVWYLMAWKQKSKSIEDAEFSFLKSTKFLKKIFFKLLFKMLFKLLFKLSSKQVSFKQVRLNKDASIRRD